jgi:hypothetical protein
MSNNITIEFSKEDRILLEDLMGSVTLLASVIGNAQPKEVQEKVIAETLVPAIKMPEEIPAADPVEENTTNAAEPAPVAETPEEVKPVSLAEFQKAVTLAVSKGADAKKAAKEIINKYAASVSAVPEDKRAEVMAELEKI